MKPFNALFGLSPHLPPPPPLFYTKYLNYNAETHLSTE